MESRGKKKENTRIFEVDMGISESSKWLANGIENRMRKGRESPEKRMGAILRRKSSWFVYT